MGFNSFPQNSNAQPPQPVDAEQRQVETREDEQVINKDESGQPDLGEILEYAQFRADQTRENAVTATGDADRKMQER